MHKKMSIALMAAIVLIAPSAFANSEFRGFRPGITIEEFRDIAAAGHLRPNSPRSTRARGLPVTEISAVARDGVSVLATFSEGAQRAYRIEATDKMGTSLYQEVVGRSPGTVISELKKRWIEDGLKLFWASGNTGGNQPQVLSITDPDLEPK